MALSPGLAQQQKQSLTLTPQLMQSIQILQMSQIELSQFITTEIERNPLLEIAAGETAEIARAPEEPQSGLSERLTETFDTGFENVFPDDGLPPRAEMPELVGQWKSMAGGSGGDCDIEDFAARPPGLRDHLDTQLPFLLHDAADRLAAQQLIDQLDPSGYFEGDIGEIAARLARPAEEIEKLLLKLQELDPAGIFARSLSECLAIQLRRKDRLDPAMAALLTRLDLLGRRDFTALRKICGVGEEDLLDMLAEIRALDPKPGSRFEPVFTETVSADVVVRRDAEGRDWIVELAPDRLPRIVVNRAWFGQLSRAGRQSKTDRGFISDCLQSANWLSRSIDQRATTIVQVAGEIVRQQDGFLKHGVAHLRPLTLKAVAEATGLHESTVSRATAGKYMLTPRGLFELRYFFTAPIAATAQGSDNHSAEAVRQRIRDLIEAETANAVLSDDDIVLALRDEGIEIARRTVAKYREALGLHSSVQRRREKRAQARALPMEA